MDGVSRILKVIHVFFFVLEWFGTKFRSSECFSLLRNDTEWNSELSYLPQTGSNGIPSVFHSEKHEEFRRENESKFPSVPWNNVSLENGNPNANTV
jgi:hypothetical protein